MLGEPKDENLEYLTTIHEFRLVVKVITIIIQIGITKGGGGYAFTGSVVREVGQISDEMRCFFFFFLEFGKGVLYQDWADPGRIWIRIPFDFRSGSESRILSGSMQFKPTLN